MERFLGIESKFAGAMTKAADLVILNALFLVSCLPIITIGSAVTALYAVTLNMCRDEEAYVVRSYLKAFRGHFFGTTVLWILVLFTGGMFWVNFKSFDMISGEALKMGLLSAAVLWGLIVPYIFPAVAWFHKSVFKTMKMSILLSFRYLGYSVLILTGSLVPVFVITRGGKAGLYGVIILLICGFATMAFLYSYLYRIIFARYE